MIKRPKKRECGQVLIIAAILMAAIMGFVGLTIDVGEAYVERGRVQQAGDAAALAAAGVMFSGGSDELAAEQALEIAAANGYTNGEGVTVTVNIPPESGPYSGIDDFAEVIIDSSSAAYFTRVLDFDVFDVDGRAVAGGINSPGNYGIIALNPHECRALDLNGTVDIVIEAAGIFVNSDCPTDAFWAEGNVTVNTDINAVVGGWDWEGIVDVNPSPSSAAAITDPLAGVPVPVPPTNVMPCPTFGGPPSAPTILLPGRYECTIDPPGPRSIIFQSGNYHITGGIIADGGGNITFNPGVYTLGGVGIRATGSGRITVNFATLYIDQGAVHLTGNGLSRLIAPTSGPYAGIVIFQNRSLTTQVDLSGTSISAGSGAIYAAAAQISIVGTASSSNMQFISDTFQMTGTSDLDLVFDDNISVEQSFLKLVE